MGSWAEWGVLDIMIALVFIYMGGIIFTLYLMWKLVSWIVGG